MWHRITQLRTRCRVPHAGFVELGAGRPRQLRLTQLLVRRRGPRLQLAAHRSASRRRHRQPQSARCCWLAAGELHPTGCVPGFDVCVVLLVTAATTRQLGAVTPSLARLNLRALAPAAGRLRAVPAASGVGPELDRAVKTQAVRPLAAVLLRRRDVPPPALRDPLARRRQTALRQPTGSHPDQPAPPVPITSFSQQSDGVHPHVRGPVMAPGS